MNIDELQARKDELSVQINAAIQLNDTATAARLQQEYQEVQAQINQAEIDGATNAVAPSTDEIQVGGNMFSVDDLARGEDEAKLIRKWIRQLRINVAEQANAHIEVVQSLNAQIADLEDRNGALDLRARDAESKRDAAVLKAEELQREVDRLNSQVDEMQKEKAVGVREAIKVIEIESEDDLNAAAERIKARKAEEARIAKEAAEAAKIRVYDLQEGDLKVSYYTAKRADNDESITIPRLELAKYVVLSNEEAARFREERQQEEAALVESIPASETPSEPVMPEVPQFQYDPTEDAQSSDGLATGNMGEPTQGATTEAVTREEFEALKAEVFEIKAKVANPQPAVWAS